MIKFLFLTIPSTHTYEQLQDPIQFPEDSQGVSNWILRLPLTIYSSDLSQKHVFTASSVEIVPLARTQNPFSVLEQKWKHFIMTRQDGKRIYCTYHVFYDRSPILRKKKRRNKENLFYSMKNIYQDEHEYVEFFMPKCLVLLAERPYFKLMVNLVKIYRELRRDEGNVCRSVSENMLNNYEEHLKRGEEAKWFNNRIAPMMQIGKDKRIPCPIETCFNFYIDACNAKLTPASLMPFIYALPPAYHSYEYIKTSKNLQILHIYKILTDEPESCYNLNYLIHLPLSQRSLAMVLSAIVQEKQIIFVSNNQNSNLMLMETLMEMIKPFRWEYMYVPVLPKHMLEAAEESFMPYMVGVHYKNLQQICLHDRVIVYVDRDTVEYKTSQSHPHLSMSSRSSQSSSPESRRRMGGKSLEHSLALPEELYQFLHFSTPNYDNYLSLEKQVKIKCAMLMSLLIERARQSSNAKNAHSLYQHLCKKSMMFTHYLEQEHQAARNSLYIQYEELIQKYPTIEERWQYLDRRWTYVVDQARHPERYDHDKEWIRYYYEYRQRNRRVRDFRVQLVNAYSISSLGRDNVPFRNSAFTPNAPSGSFQASNLRRGNSELPSTMIRQSIVQQNEQPSVISSIVTQQNSRIGYGRSEKSLLKVTNIESPMKILMKSHHEPMHTKLGDRNGQPHASLSKLRIGNGSRDPGKVMRIYNGKEEWENDKVLVFRRKDQQRGGGDNKGMNLAQSMAFL